MRLAREHYENFPVGSWMLPKAWRRDLHRIYAFARTADDLADELRDRDALAAYRASFLAHVQGEPTTPLPLFVDLGKTITARALPVSLFTDLLDAFAQDLDVRRYGTVEALFGYCEKSANPVGRLVLRVAGLADAELDRLSDRICTGLQLVNHLQDIRSDLVERDRIYFPAGDLARHGVGEDDLRAAQASPQVRAFVAEWTERCAELLREGWPLCAALRGRLRLEIRAIVGGAAGVLDAIRAADHDVLAEHRRLGKGAKLGVVVRALLSSRLPRGIR